MTREDVIGWLEYLSDDARSKADCLVPTNIEIACSMAIEALKAQEPRLVTESDFDGADEFGYIPVWTEEKDGDMYWECIPKTAITDPDGIEVLRYWTSRPDEKRRSETPWELKFVKS